MHPKKNLFIFLFILLATYLQSSSFAFTIFDSIQTALSNSTDINKIYLDLETQKTNYHTNKRRLKFDGSVNSEDNKSQIAEATTHLQKFGGNYGISIPSILYSDLKLGYNYDMTKYLSSAITTETKAVSFSTEFPLLKSGYYLKQKENIALRVQLESGYDQYIQQKQNIIEQVVQSFFNLYLKKRDLEIAEKDYEFQKHLAEIIENKYKAGSFSRIEVDRIELEMLMSEQKIKLLKNSLFEMEKKFFVMIGTEAKDYDLGINLDSFNIQPKQITSDLINEIINKNIDLKTLDNNKKLLLMERENLNFFNQSNIFCNASFKNENDYSAMSGVKIFLPDFVQDKSKKHLLDIQIKQHENSVLQAKNSLDENITAIKTSFEEYDFNIEIAKKSIAIAKKILEIDQLNYEKGSLPQDKLLESQQRYQQEILNMEKYKIDAILSTIKLDKLLCNVGKEDYILWLKQ